MASSTQRLLPVALVLLLAGGGAAYWLLGGAGGVEDPGGGLEGAPVVEAPRAPEPRDLRPTGERSAGEVVSPARLEVVVQDPEGRLLPDCEVQVENGEGLPLGGRGGRTFPRLAAGTWTLTITHPRYLEVRQQLELAPGAEERVVVRMSETVRVTGRVHDRFGSPLRGHFAYFLRPGEAFPQDVFESRQRLGAQIDPSGSFALDLPAEVPLTLELGFPANPRYRVPGTTRLTAGGPTDVTVTVPGATRLVVEVTELREEVREGKVSFNVQVLQQRKGKRAERVREEQEALAEAEARRRAIVEERRRQRRAARKGTEGEPEAQDPGLPDLATEPEAAAETWTPTTLPDRDDGTTWQVLQTLRYPGSGPLVVENLPAGKNLTLALVRKRERFESENVFTLQPDSLMTVRFENPPRPGERDPDQGTQPLFLSVLPSGLPADAPPPGAVWE